MNNRKLKISEIFFSIQGEGIFIDRPSIFIRTALCNLKCHWCDTPYTWDWENYDIKKEVVEVEVDEVLVKIRQWDCKNIVLTGGEPMIQQKELIALMQKLKPEGYFFEVETNGTMAILPEFDRLIDQYNCSPKMKNSANAQATRETKHFKTYAQNPKSVFKFVVDREEDLVEIEIFVKKYNIPPSCLLLMPQARTKQELQKKFGTVSDWAIKKGWGFSTRRHIELWGNRRGV